MTDVAAPAFACGAALMGRRPIFVVRYQGFMWYNCSSIINYAARSKQVWGKPVPIFVRSIGMEGNGIGHTASSCLHSVFMHVPGLPVAAPMTPGEYEAVWSRFMQGDDPMYVSEHRRSFALIGEMEAELSAGSRVTILAVSAARLNSLEATAMLRSRGVEVDLFHLLWLKPLEFPPGFFESLQKTRRCLIVDSDFELAGAAQSIAYEVMHRCEARAYALGLEDRVCGVARHLENITPSADRIARKVEEILT